MDLKDILRKVDHTLLSQTSTEGDIKKLLDDGMRFNVASCCIPPGYVGFAADYVSGRLPICTVIGFPNGYNITEVKAFETEKALSQGADEIDMVINIGMVKDRRFNMVQKEIESLKAICGDKILKVIIETCLLTDEEKIRMCQVVTDAGANFIKTSTGFSSGGATFDDIQLFSRNVGENVKIKASGGISSIDDAVRFIELGASRLGTSRIVKLAISEVDNGSENTY